tara:strand:- start:250 stop:609 length:360 start_codon:yes stop_codon:yes gene_type:complete
MEKKLTFGVEPTMREVPPGETATFKVGNVSDWKIVETEWGEKYSFPIVLLQHPSYESIPKKGMEMKWQSKSSAAVNLYLWMYTKDNVMRVFDIDQSKELNGNFVLHRWDSGSYMLEVQG